MSVLISVLMTSYNREQYIAEAIDSVIASTYTHWELIIVDDGSKDNTVAIAQGYAAKDDRIKVYINEKNLGDYPNRNKAASYAKGKYLKYVDSDDAIYSHTLFEMVSQLEKAPGIGIGLGLVTRDHCTEENVGKVWTPKEAYKKQFFQDGFLENGPLGALILREAFEKAGGFSGKRMIGDVEMWLKIALHYKVVELPKNLVFYRVHDNQESTSGFEYYLIGQLQVYVDALNHPDCPLSSNEKKQVVSKRKKQSYYWLCKQFLKNGKLTYCLSLAKKISQIKTA